MREETTASVQTASETFCQKTVIQYECMTSFKYIWIFYAIQYAIVGLITLVIGIVSGSFENVGTNCLEINTLFFVSILGALGYCERSDIAFPLNDVIATDNAVTIAILKYLFIKILNLFDFH